VWYANAQDIADFLAATNTAWKQAEMRSMMRTHITQTVGYAADVLAGNYPTAIEKYDAAEAHMSEMADMLSAGIIKQFPQRFSAGTSLASRT
jgi:cytochrome c556